MPNPRFTPSELAARDRDAFRASDLLASGYTPKPSDLAGAPVIDSYKPVAIGTDVVLVGIVSGHPHLPDGPVRTSAVLAADTDAGWARTYGRWYRLGSKWTPEPTAEIVPEAGVAEEFPEDEQTVWRP